MNVLMPVGLERFQTLEKRLKTVAGIFGSCEVPGQAMNFLDQLSGVVVLLYHQAHRILNCSERHLRRNRFVCYRLLQTNDVGK